MEDFLEEAFGEAAPIKCEVCNVYVSSEYSKQEDHRIWKHPTQRDIDNTKRTIVNLAGKVEKAKTPFDLAYYSAKLAQTAMMLKSQTEAIL